MFETGDKVIVAVSGGPDSICLLHILYSFKDRLGITLAAAHVNHCLRGEESDADEEYVREFCKNVGIECYINRVDINKLSYERNLSSESAGREARYEFFEEIYTKVGAKKIALAHNANDQAETILMRLMRGSGMEGLIGIKPVRDKKFVRPIINITRTEIEEYCKENGIIPRIDRTNMENIYSRNKVRLELIPYIKKNFNQDIVNTLNRLGDTIRKDNEYIEEVAQNKYKEYCDKKRDRVIIIKEAFKEPEAILSRIIRNALLHVKGNLYNFEKVHIYDIINIQKHSTGKKIYLPGNIMALNNYGDVHIYIDNKEENTWINNEYALQLNKENIIEPLKIKIHLRIVDRDEEISLKESEFIKYFNYDRFIEKVILRFRKSGDKFMPLGMNGSKKLKDIFIDLKVPKEERDAVPLICFDDEIAWIVGYRVSENHKIHRETKNILEIKVEREGTI